MRCFMIAKNITQHIPKILFSIGYGVWIEQSNKCFIKVNNIQKQYIRETVAVREAEQMKDKTMSYKHRQKIYI